MTIKIVDVKTLKQWIDHDEAVVIDVREPAEHLAKKIHGTTLVPLSQINKKSLPLSTGKKLVIHCHSGTRSTAACKKLLSEDPNLEIYNLEGGISAWSAIGEKVLEGQSILLPLDRQVQLTIGIGVLLGSFLGYFINPLFFLLTGFFGSGLIFAGLSGFCGLAILMAKMPWNRR